MTIIEITCAAVLLISAIVAVVSYYFVSHPPHRHTWKTTDSEKINIYSSSTSTHPHKRKKTLTLTCTSCGEVKFVTTTL